MDLARRGARVLLLCRSAERGQAAAESIIDVINTESKSRRRHSKPTARGLQHLRNNNNDEDGGESGGNVQPVDVQVYQVNLASTSSIRECAKHITKNETKVDILVNNAGMTYCRTFDGGFNYFLGKYI